MKMENQKEELLKQIMEMDFTIVELNLYLNTHIMDQAVIAYFNSCVTKSLEMKEQYEKQFGMLTASMDRSPYPWQWVNEPWPWEYEANIALWEKEK